MGHDHVYFDHMTSGRAYQGNPNCKPNITDACTGLFLLPADLPLYRFHEKKRHTEDKVGDCITLETAS